MSDEEYDPFEGSPAAVAFEIYVDESGEWRWRLRHRNGNIIADGGEGYTTRQKAREGLGTVKVEAPEAPVSVHPEAAARAKAHEQEATERAQDRFDELADETPAEEGDPHTEESETPASELGGDVE